MDFELSSAEKESRDRAAALATAWEGRALEVGRHLMEHSRFHPEFWSALEASGFMGMMIDREHGGSDKGLLRTCLFIEELAGRSLFSFLLVLTHMNAYAVRTMGSKELQERILPDVAQGKMTIGFAFTEEDAGHNFFRMKTRLKHQGEKVIVEGTKTYITGADVVDRLLVVGRSMDTKELEEAQLPRVAGFSAVLVDPRRAGLEKEPIPACGVEGARVWKLHFRDLEADARDMVGEEHRFGLRLFPVLNAERIMTAALAVGEVEYALRRAIDWAKHRRVGDDEKPIAVHQAIQHPLATMRCELEAVRLLVYRAASSFDQGHDPREVGALANMAKLVAGELAIRAVDQALQVMGAAGFREDQNLIQHYLTVRLMRSAPVAREMVLNDIAQHVLGLPQSY